MPGRPRRGRFFCGFTPAGHKRPRASLGVRSAGRVRLSDHPRRAMLFAVFLRVAVIFEREGALLKRRCSFSFVAACGPQGFSWREVRRPGSALRPPPRTKCPCHAGHGTGARGPRLRAEKACGPQRRATLPCKPSYKHLCSTIRQPAPAGVSRLCGAAIPNTGAPGRCGTLQHTRCAELPGSLPGTIRASAKARVTPWISLRTSVLPGAWLHHPTPHNLTSFDCAGTPGPFALRVTLLNSQFPVQLPLLSAFSSILLFRTATLLTLGSHISDPVSAQQEVYFLDKFRSLLLRSPPGRLLFLTASGPLLLCLSFPAKWHPRWWAREVKRWLCFCAHRVVNGCAAYPTRAGGKKTKLDPGGRTGRPVLTVSGHKTPRQQTRPAPRAPPAGNTPSARR